MVFAALATINEAGGAVTQTPNPAQTVLLDHAAATSAVENAASTSPIRSLTPPPAILPADSTFCN